MKINYSNNPTEDCYEQGSDLRLLSPYWTLDAENYSREAYRTEKMLRAVLPHMDDLIMDDNCLIRVTELPAILNRYESYFHNNNSSGDEYKLNDFISLI